MEVLDYRHFPAENILEVWLSIYEKLGPDDKVTFSRACAEWHDLVARKRTTILFPQVAVLLLGRIPVSSLKQCRTVCRSWAQKIDSLHQYYPSDRLLYIGTEYEEVSGYEDVLNYKFGSADEIQRFMADMSGHPGNPLPGRNISFQWKVPERDVPPAPIEIGRLWIEYWTAVTVLLSKYGNYINDATFVIGEDENQFPGIEIVGHFRNCLLNLPNLRRFTFHSLVTELEVADLRLNPLPRLHNLEAVEIIAVDEFIAEAFLIICLVPASVKVVWINPPRVPPVVYSFFNLESLTLNSSVFTIEGLKIFRNLPQVPPLRYLSLNVSSAMNALEVLSLLEPFSDTLTGLVIISWLNPVDEINGLRVNLPKLEMLCLNNYRGSFDLFVGFTSLRILGIDKPFIRRRRTSNGAQIREFETRLNESNIWERLPALEEIRVGRGDNMKVYKRYVVR